ncbi:ATP-binding protein [Puteibacter caeruleilacunae]|nr:ATP-binding protein [Puteibacter caeruleilacunae]
MILEIRLSNFYSIKEEVILDLRAANLKSKNARELSSNLFEFNDTDILKTVVIYGANASGKSNIIKAIRFCCAMILNSHNHNENIKFNYKKFKFNRWHNKPSTFFIAFISNGIEYEYSFSIMQDRVLSESLHYSPKGRISKVFTRKERKGAAKSNIYSFGSGINSPMGVATNTSDKTLYLSRASQMDRPLAKELFNYFNSTFLLGYTGQVNSPNIEPLLVKFKDQMLEALKLADSDIVDFKFKKVKAAGKDVRFDVANGDVSVKDIIEDQLQIKTYHSADPSISFDLLSEESAGTIKLFYMMVSILDIVVNDKILLIDEIGESLHTDIIDYIFNIFQAGKRAQLICTTHNTKFLDLTKFRKDQIFFVNKKEDASSDLYSLYDYSDFRDTMDLEKAYLQGRFDAVPIVNDSLATLKSLIDGK